MSTIFPDRSPPAASRGFLIPSAIFLLVVLAGLAAFLVTISSGQHTGAAQDVVGARAYQAARSGLEWGFYHTLAVKPETANVCSGKPGLSTNLDTTAFPGLSLTVNCEAVSTGVIEAGNPVVLYKITATACSQPNVATPACPNTTNPGPLYVEGCHAEHRE